VILLCALVAASLAAPQQAGEAKIVRFENENIGVDGYKFR
jgi:hypothetical protein